MPNDIIPEKGIARNYFDAFRVKDDVTRDILSHVTEFLSFHDFPDTVSALHKEREGKATLPSVTSSIGNHLLGKEHRDKLRSEMLRAFDEGKRGAFFTSFQQFVPASALSFDMVAQRLEFNVNVYFAIYPVLPSSSVLVAMPATSRSPSFSRTPSHNRLSPNGQPDSRCGSPGVGSQPELSVRMKTLKAFLETRGAWLAHSGEFLAFYALPFVSHPEHHPSFEHLFQPDWVANLKQALREYLDSIPAVKQLPRLYDMYEAFHLSTDEDTRVCPQTIKARVSQKAMRPASRSRDSWILRQSGPNVSSPIPVLPDLHNQGRTSRAFSTLLQQQAAASSIPTGSSMGQDGEGLPPRPLMRQGQSLGRSRIPGPPVPKAAIGASPLRLVTSAGHTSLDVSTSLPSKHSMARPNDQQPTHNLTADELDVLDEVLRCTVTLPRDVTLAAASRGAMPTDAQDWCTGEAAYEKEPSAVTARHGSSPECSPIIDRNHLQTTGPHHLELHSLPAPLDCKSIKRAVILGVQEGGMAADLAARLLQALRWRLVRSNAGLDRSGVMANWLEQDLLGCRNAQLQDGEALLQVLSGCHDLVLLEEAARLGNAVASDQNGRSYLLECPSTVPALIAMLKVTPSSAELLTSTALHREPPGTISVQVPAMAPGDAALPRPDTGGNTGGAGARLYRQDPAAASCPDGRSFLSLEGKSTSAAPSSSNARCQVNDREAEAGQPESGSLHDGALLQQALVALQKLSLRRQGQSQMVQHGLLQWLVMFLQDWATLSEFTLEYACALLMNLCLRTAGKAASQEPAKRTPLLQLCECLIESNDEQIRTYACGILYSVLQNPAVRAEAQARDLAGLLRAVAASSASQLSTHQIQYIVEQLETDAPAKKTEPGDESDDGADEDEDDMNDEDAFANVEMAPESWTPAPGTLQGEALLCSSFLAGIGDAQQQARMVRSSLALATGAAAKAVRMRRRQGARSTDTYDEAADAAAHVDTSTTLSHAHSSWARLADSSMSLGLADSHVLTGSITYTSIAVDASQTQSMLARSTSRLSHFKESQSSPVMSLEGSEGSSDISKLEMHSSAQLDAAGMPMHDGGEVCDNTATLLMHSTMPSLLKSADKHVRVSQTSQAGDDETLTQGSPLHASARPNSRTRKRMGPSTANASELPAAPL